MTRRKRVSAAPLARDPWSILIVDDEVPIRFAMRAYFNSLGYHADCAGTRVEAETMLGQRRYSVMLADLRLGTRDAQGGLELLDHVRKRAPNTRAVIMSAFGTAATEETARELGAAAFLHKPAPLSDIARLIAALLLRQRLEGKS